MANWRHLLSIGSLMLAFGTSLLANSKHPLRDYFRGITSEERQHIHYIVETLAHHNLANIWLHQNDLTTAGDHLASMHPFRFLEVLLADHHVRAGVLKIKDRSLVWPNFYEGIRGSLQIEFQRHNLTAEQVHDFSHRIHQDPTWVMSMISQQRWDQLVEGLFTSVEHRYRKTHKKD